MLLLLLYRGGDATAGPAEVGLEWHLPEVWTGPPLRGAPWAHRLTPEPFLVTPPPPEARVQVYAPEITFGPAVPGAPWLFPRSFSQEPFGVVGPPADLPTTHRPAAGRGSPLLARVVMHDQRHQRFTEQLSEVVNSLAATGQLIREGAARWRVVPGVVSGGAPSGGNDVTEGFHPGALWVDEGAGAVYVCVANADGAAVWRRLQFAT
jgi:hypothetical protein